MLYWPMNEEWIETESRVVKSTWKPYQSEGLEIQVVRLTICGSRESLPGDEGIGSIDSEWPRVGAVVGSKFGRGT